MQSPVYFPVAILDYILINGNTVGKAAGEWGYRPLLKLDAKWLIQLLPQRYVVITRSLPESPAARTSSNRFIVQHFNPTPSKLFGIERGRGEGGAQFAALDEAGLINRELLPDDVQLWQKASPD